ncbi:MAG: DUF4040 domain-containing protein [Verrucomicrobia bacterium]|nr:DUF4040 domain-containing protein [Verrucomicrobiota bacterium]
MDWGLAAPLLLCLVGAPLAAASGAGPAALRRPRVLGAILATLPLAAAAWLATRIPAVIAGGAPSLVLPWMPSAGLAFTLQLDGLSLLFALLITGIGALVTLYAGFYLDHDPAPARFLATLLAFMTSMLGLVLAGDLFTLFVFWEGTSVASYLLIAHRREDPAARRAALKALLVTGAGGAALLAGFALLAHVAGGVGFDALRAAGDGLRGHRLYPVMLVLIAAGAFSKSAQFPLHTWLPDAMAAPTPASAYLHSATMVKAGIYLMARLNPMLGGTEMWFWLLSLSGLVTMLVGAYRGLRRNDMKAVLAYSTVSQLGVLMMLIGQDTAIAFKALVIGVFAHALYKSSLFMVAGIVEHAAGTRDLRRLGGLRHAMPATFAVAVVAALSMAGLPPLAGFLAKETLIATAVHPSDSSIFDLAMTAATVLAGSMIFAQAATLIARTFLGRPAEAAGHAHEAPALMILAPAIPAVVSLIFALLPEPAGLAVFFAQAAEAAHGGTVKVSLAVWTGVTTPLLLGGVAMSLGVAVFLQRRRARNLEGEGGAWTWGDRAYEYLMRGVDAAAARMVRVQDGRLRRYLVAMLAAVGVLLALFGAVPLPGGDPHGDTSAAGWVRAFAALVALGAALVSARLRSDILAILALAASGLSVALYIALEPAVDVALVQVVVDILTTVLLVLALKHLPRAPSAAAGRPSPGASADRLRGLAVAVAAGAVMAAVAYAALESRPRGSAVTPFYEANAVARTGASDVVGSIVVDFRGYDTLIEITVFGAAGLAVALLLRGTARRRAAVARRADATQGIAGPRTSVFLQFLAWVILPLALVLAATRILYGHDQPGDGFTAGVTVSLGVALWQFVFGPGVTRRRLHWARPRPLIGAGLALAVAGAAAPVLAGQAFFSPFDFGHALGLPLPPGVHLGTAMAFELAICLTVLGSAVHMLESFGDPRTVAEEGAPS